MLSLTPPKPTATPFSPSPHRRHQRPSHLKPISSSSRRPPSPPPPPPLGTAYQPFRPPPVPLPPQYRSLSPTEILSILRDRLGRWHDYAPLISSLSNQGFDPPSIEESTGLSGVEQNRLAVASRVRETLLPSLPPDLLSFFDSAGTADSLYALRLLNASQRVAAATRVAALNLDPKAAHDLARAIKDFPRRRGDDGWASFSADSPGDCLAFTYFRLSREVIDEAEKILALEKALESAETEEAKKRIAHELERASAAGGGEEEDELAAKMRVPVVRLKYGEVAEAASVALLPVCRATEGVRGVEEAPRRLQWEGDLGVVSAEKGWGRWVVLPGWAPVLGLGGESGVAVEFADDARGIPWGKRKEEGVLVVVDRKRKEVVDGDGFYLVGSGGEEGLGVERGKALAEKGVKEGLGSVVMVVRPPSEEDNQLADEDWD
ncbi:rubisco accumulation factor 1, chloroplastic [Iris pallida]|uniref:Rubisco accumulation factor 1, chloroplastic n=1 Tax=Iris pallida TaxID=29817 RepID=A0AAX6HQ28_IRIPA|nr:rubisco accumulation factor 1, chloroplastic [Iris pallida]